MGDLRFSWRWRYTSRYSELWRQRYNSEYLDLNLHRRENLKSSRELLCVQIIRGLA